MQTKISADVMVDREVTIRVKKAYKIKEALKADGYKFDGVEWVLNYPLTAKTQDDADREALKFSDHISLLAIYGVELTEIGAVNQLLGLARDAKERQIQKKHCSQ